MDANGGQLSGDGSKIYVTVDQLEGTYAIVSSAEPLGIRDLRLHPNPFSPHNGGQLTFDFRLTSDQSSRPNLSIKIYNMAGQLVRALIRSEDMEKGTLLRRWWNGTTDDGRMARNGRYVVVMIVKDSSDEVKEIRTVVLVK
ncbi:MAG: FlgD immunoglobulin-like domain containing protein [Candidatus Electryoneaceae bacterium]|nr:FlgD immunoglobulin-like domain containing protein [Candidatus Electryoneaceae bacterium]